MFGIQNFIPRLIEYLSKVVTVTLIFERLVNDIFVLHQEEISKSYSFDNIVKKIFIFFAQTEIIFKIIFSFITGILLAYSRLNNIFMTKLYSNAHAIFFLSSTSNPLTSRRTTTYIFLPRRQRMGKQSTESVT
jgi:hypothetical protein